MSLSTRILSALVDPGDRYEFDVGDGKTLADLAREARGVYVDAWARMVIAHHNRPPIPGQGIVNMALLESRGKRTEHPLDAMSLLKFGRPEPADAFRFIKAYRWLLRGEGPIAFLHEPTDDPFGFRSVLVLQESYFCTMLTADYIGRKWDKNVRIAVRA